MSQFVFGSGILWGTAQTDAAGLMIGRGCIRNPWIFGRSAPISAARRRVSC